jgi:putative Holliday junction resolvase
LTGVGQGEEPLGELAWKAASRVVGIDLGERRIGVSVSDSSRTLATPHSVITRSGDRAADRRAIAALVTEVGAGLVVVGLPLTLSGARGPAATEAEQEAAQIAAELSVPVVLHDERLTTVEAARRRSLSAPTRSTGGDRPRSLSRRSGTGGGPARRTGIDAVAATVLLQSWLEQNRGET